MRGAVVEWLQRLGCDAESRRQVVSSRLGLALRRPENSLSKPSSKSVPFSNSGSERSGMGYAFHLLCPRYSGTLTPLHLRLLGYGTLYLNNPKDLDPSYKTDLDF